MAGTGTVRLLGFAALSALRGCQLVISSSDPQGVGSELRLIGGTFTLDEGVDMYVPENLRVRKQAGLPCLPSGCIGRIPLVLTFETDHLSVLD